MKRFAIASIVAASLGAPGMARAQSSYTTYTFTAVDGVRYIGGTAYLYVTGVLDGAPAATEEQFRSGTTGFSLLECQRFALIAMSKPGQYHLSFYAARVTPTTGAPYYYATNCSLVRATP